MPVRYLLFVDFDGVICDSINECFLSSWIAFFRYYKQAEPASVSLAARQEFGALRPYIRNGEDYLLLQDLLAGQQKITSQAQFDVKLALTGTKQMQQYKQLFYKARNYLVESDFTFWCAINILYPHMADCLAQYAAHPDLYILSTKKPAYIMEILRYNRIIMEEKRILYPDGCSKYSLIKGLLDTKPLARAVFIDDQIDHLLQARDERIQPYLPSWGYIKQEWLQREIPVLYPVTAGEPFTLLAASP